VQIHLRDINTKLITAWQAAFADRKDVTVSQGDIFAVPADAIVSPANSYGVMDGGIDRIYSERFGWDLQARLQQAIRASHGRLLPVGEALVVPTNDPQIPWLVSAPTMVRPGNVADTDNAFLAFRAALRAARALNKQHRRAPIQTLLCPGMCTAAGRMPPARAAAQMRRALG